MIAEARDSYTLEEAAARVGVTSKTLTDQIKAGKLKSRKLGRRHMITPQAITDWLDGLPVVEAEKRT